MTIWRVLHEQLLYPYLPQEVQGVLLGDFPRRQHFCEDLKVHLCSHAKYFSRMKQIFQETASQTFIICVVGPNRVPTR
jgi:hypothetical protein